MFHPNQPKPPPARVTSTHAALLLAALTCGGWTSAALAGSDTTTPMQADVFHDADANRDGRLSFDEFQALEPIAGAHGEAAGQGLPATEHQAAAMRQFKQEDANSDGYISADEINRAR